MVVFENIELQQIFKERKKFPTGPFAIFEPHNQEIVEINVVQRMLKLQNCERVGRAAASKQDMYGNKSQPRLLHKKTVLGSFNHWTLANVKLTYILYLSEDRSSRFGHIFTTADKTF